MPINLLVILSSAYLISQFYRSSLGVLSPDLMHELFLGPEFMGRLGGVFFLTFAIAQIPLGILLDKFGPRKIMSFVIIFSAIGSIIFGCANTNYMLIAGRAFMGLGCSVCLMGSLVLITKWASPDRFATYAGLILGIGGLGGLLATSPLAMISHIIGWRNVFFIMSVVTLMVVIIIFLFVRDSKNEPSKKSNNKDFLDVSTVLGLKLIFSNRDFRLMLPMSIMGYASYASIVTLWGGPYLRDIHHLGTVEIGNVLMLMALSWVFGSFVFGRSDTILNTRKYIVIFGSLGFFLILMIFSFVDSLPKFLIFSLFLSCGFMGAYSAVLLAHFKSLFPEEYTGRVLTTSNFFNFGGVFLVQWCMGMIIEYFGGNSMGASQEAYKAAFIFTAFGLLLATLLYAFTKDIKPRPE